MIKCRIEGDNMRKMGKSIFLIALRFRKSGEVNSY